MAILANISAIQVTPNPFSAIDFKAPAKGEEELFFTNTGASWRASMASTTWPSAEASEK